MPGLRLRAELNGDGSGFHAMMNRADAAKDKFAKAFGGLKNVIAGVFTVGAITAFSKKVIDAGSHLRDLSERLGVNVEWLQETGFAAKQAGADVDKLTKFLEKIGENREMALQGGESGRMKLAAFERFGISEDVLRSSNLQSLFDRIAQAFKDGSQQALAPALKEVGGKSAYEMAAAFKEGIEDNRQLARDAGVVMSEDTIDALKAMGDQLTTLQEQLMSSFAPAIVWVADQVANAVNVIKQGGALLGGASARPVSKREMTISLLGSPLAAFLPRLFGKDAQAAAVAEIESQQKQAAAAAEARRLTLDLRRQRENAPADVAPLITREREERAKAVRGPGLVTDSLVGVGNFLGRNPALVNSVANQQLQVTRQQLRMSEQTYQLLKERLMNPHNLLSNLNVPN